MIPPPHHWLQKQRKKNRSNFQITTARQWRDAINDVIVLNCRWKISTVINTSRSTPVFYYHVKKNKNLDIRREPRIPSLSATRKGAQISGAVLQIPKPLKSELFFAFPPKIQSFIPPFAGRTSPDSGEGSRVSFLPRPRRLCKLLLRLASASARGCWGRGGVWRWGASSFLGLFWLGPCDLFELGSVGMVACLLVCLSLLLVSWWGYVVVYVVGKGFEELGFVVEGYSDLYRW